MTEVLLARIQFALVVGFHYIYPSVTIGLSWFIFLMMALWFRTGDAVYRSMARFWVKVFAIGFAIGVATGVVMEFQFGTNWAAYSRFVGDIFGAPLAAEGVIAFFLESTFLGMLLFGWDRLSRRAHLFASLMIAVGSTSSAFWIIVANSWQQTPAGYKIVQTAMGRRAELTDFWAAVFNPSTMPRFYHVIVGSILVSGFFLMSVAAFHLLRRQHVEFAKRTMTIGLTVTFLFSLGQLYFGHHQAIRVWQTQPLKLAALEGHFDTGPRAPLLAFGIPNEQKQRTDLMIPLPGMLSFLLTGDANTVVQGLKDFPRDQWPPVLLSFAFFHLMVVLGTFFILFSAVGIFLLWRRKLFDNRWFLRAAALCSPLPFVADHAGWIAAEIGRQPWIVYGELRTSEAISRTVGTGELTFSLVLFTLLYTALFFIWLFVLTRKILQGPEPVVGSGNGRA